MELHKELLRAVYACDCCPPSFGFARPAPEKAYYKFAATIGAVGHAPLLFVGINPRIDDANRSHGNRKLHERLMAKKSAFADLAKNLDGFKPYIAPGCSERHYHWHMAVVQAIFGADAKFEGHAAVTELFFCATGNAKNLPIRDSPCAKLNFEGVFLKVRPVLVLPVFPPVLAYLQKIAGVPGKEFFLLTVAEHTALVVDIRRATDDAVDRFGSA